MKFLTPFKALLLILVFAFSTTAHARSVTDSMDRTVDIPEKVSRVICSGPGALRLLTYLEAESMAVAVDDIEAKRRAYEARPYALANPQFKEMPIFGSFRGHDNPELILSLEPQPQVVLKTYPTMGHDPIELQQKTGIPVITLEYGNLGKKRQQLYRSLRIMGEVIGKQQRAEEVIAFIDAKIADLEKRTADIPEKDRPTVFVGGVAFKGPHGYQSTEPGYPPFTFVHANNLAYDSGLTGKDLQHSDIAKEKIVEWNPDFLFLDLSTLRMGDDASGLYELQTDLAYRTLDAVKAGKVYGLLPYNWYTQNYGSVLANAYYIGKLLYPDHFTDVDTAAMADEIYTFLVGKPVFGKMNSIFQNLAYKPVPVN
ncbi:iron ABC transporter substrate-binding protein [uncultured Pseudodesulfovibrio sp.]|uniref:iron ABC transporter substrate-binding protein n=1 Tax=uncultured Pseudodesulfovibrio sp. TaxID=2035858 RepID=UPI0029C74615|nr:iron ABC transporter substrate-binding protein [uncultured Pseudodesulfovibrio sp.]